MWSLLESKLEVLGEALNGEETIDNDYSVQNMEQQATSQNLMDEFFEKLLEDFENYDERNKERKGRVARRKERIRQKKSEEEIDLDLDEETKDETEYLQVENEKKRKAKSNLQPPRKTIMVEDSFGDLGDVDDVLASVEKNREKIQKSSRSKLEQFMKK